VNVILVPALLLLIGLAVYKKVIEPRRAAGGGPREGKPSKPSKRADKRATQARAAVPSGRGGSVL
jgi:hypothetical protein